MNESRIRGAEGDVKSAPKAKFMRESFGDKYQADAGKEFTKTWTFRNEGEESWPSDTKFVFINGAEFGETVKDLTHEVK
jgi:Ig-like domain from next to BRCA1 gene